MHIHIYLTHALDSCILDVYTSRYIMHKCVYTVTLDIECWDDLKVEKIDWAKSINLFPDEFIHSSVQERTSPRPVDRAWSGTIKVDRENRYIPAGQKLLQKITDIISELGEWRMFSISPTSDSCFCYTFIIVHLGWISSSCVPLYKVSTTGCFLVWMEYSRNVNVIPALWTTKKS